MKVIKATNTLFAARDALHYQLYGRVGSVLRKIKSHVSPLKRIDFFSVFHAQHNNLLEGKMKDVL